MKRLFFLLIVAVASVLPQSVWAAGEASYDGQTKTLTIDSSAPGNTGSYVSVLNFSASDKALVEKIVLRGYFNESDLQSIQYSAGFTGVTEVDMGDAQFVLTSSGAPDQAYYLLYNTGAALPDGTTGDRAIVGGTLYKSAQNGTWTSVGAPAEGTTVVDDIDTDITTGYAIGTYGKNNPVAKYVQMNITYDWSSGYSIPVPESATDLTNEGNTERAREYVTSTLSASDYPEQNVWIYYYYKSSNDEGSWHWVDTDKAGYDAGSTKYDNPTDADINHLSNNFAGENRTLRVKVYFTSVATRTWTDKPDGAGAPAQFTDMSAYEYAYCDNHKTGYSNGEWVKLTSWSYYQFQASYSGTGWHWEQVLSYENGEGHYINKKYPSGTDMSSTQDGMPNADNQYAVVMGSNSGDGEFYRNGSTWKDPSDVSNTPHYVDMKFTYWSSTLQRAITSKYADEDINPDIFQNCTALTYVDFKAGVVKGFGDHKSEAGYTDNSLTVNIGQNVTKIASNAFLRCTALKAVTFDAGNGSTDAITGKEYPLTMEIGDGAFQACSNLVAIEIPNRVTVIGNDAFKEAGNNVTEFVVEFQRRYDDHGQTQPTDGWLPGMNLAIGSDAFAYCTKLKHISLPIRMTSMGTGIFQNSGLESFEIREDREDSKLETIPANAFLACKLKEINIPRSVNLIESGAFSNTPTIETIRFQMKNGTSTQTPLVIETGAFSGGNEQNQVLKDVYVDFLPSERMVICEYNAFNFTSMVGQTNTENRQFAKLHFPKKAWDYYQGDWKRGLAFRQDNLNAFKDGYNGKWGGIESENNCVGFGTAPINSETGKYTKEGYEGDNAKYIAPANGWQQFAYSDTDIDILIPWGSFMRTFSTTTPYVIPTYAKTETSNGITVTAGKPMFKIYRITAFSDGWETGMDKASQTAAQNATRVAKALEVNDNDRSGRAYIPSETGLMMVGLINADYIVYFADADFTSGGSEKTEKKYPYNISGYTDASPSDMNVNDGTDINLLYPSCISDHRMNGEGGTTPELDGEPVIINDNGVSKIQFWSTIPYPYYNLSELKFRLFGYSASKNKFIRSEGGKVTRDKAYLKLTPDMFHWSNEYNGNDQSGSSSGVTDPAPAGAREITLSFFDDEEEGGTTVIKQVNTTAQRVDSNVFYTLEGVKLNSRPTQRGIYIHNGRKVVIK